jgi:iron complex outermembrane recepter protein
MRRIGPGRFSGHSLIHSYLPSGDAMQALRLGLAGAAILLVSVALPSTAQTGRIRGRVADSAGAAIPGALLTVEGTLLRATAGQQGDYLIGGVPSGVHTVRARRIGYGATSVLLSVPAGGEVRHDFVLTRSAVELAPINITVGSRAFHTAAEELAVPVDVFGADQIKQVGSTETSEVLAQLSLSVNFPRQSVADASDIVRPFTLRGLSPDHALVLVNGYRRHRTALVHNFAAGMGAGSSGVDMNALPASAIDRIEVLRDGAAAQYGSDAIAGVVNVVIKEGGFNPFLRADFGRYLTGPFPDDGTTYNVGGGWGIPIGRGSISLFGEYRHRDPTNRAGADPEDQVVEGDADEVDANGKVITKNNPVPQPNHHWGDGLAKDALGFLNARFPLNPAGTSELYAFGGYSYRIGTGNGFRRQAISDRNWPAIYPLGYLPEFHPTVKDGSGAAGVRGAAGGWSYDVGASFGANSFKYDLRNTMNVSLGPCLVTACAPGLDGIPNTADDPGIPNKTRIDAGTLKLNELVGALSLSKPVEIGLPSRLNVATGLQFRRESYRIVAGEPASYIQGGHTNQYGGPAPPGSQVFGGFQPANEVDEHRQNVGGYLDLETNLSKAFLANAAGRFEHYSDFGSKLTGKLALRFAPSDRVTLRGAVSTGFRAPSPSQQFYFATITNFVLDTQSGHQTPVEGGIFPVAHPAAIALGAKPLKAETSINLSAGLAVSPSARVTFTGDVFYVKIDGRIILTGVLGGPGVEAILQSQGITDVTTAQYFTNALDTRSIGADLTGTLRVAVPEGQRLDLSGAFNWTKNRILHVTEPPELAGTGAVLFDPFVSGGSIALEKERPDWRSTFTADYGRGAFHALVRSSLYGKYTTSQLSGTNCPDCVQRIGSAALFDLEVGYLLPQNLNLSMGVKNLFDKYPDRLNPDNSFGIFLYPQPSPFGYNGRFVYTRMELTIGR